MKIISPSFEIMSLVDGKAVLNHIEKCGRVCYKSEDKITETSAAAFVAGIIKRGHEAVLEHFNITVIRPVFLAEGTPGWDIWRDACRCAEDAALEGKVNFLIKVLKFIIAESGFELLARIELKDKKTGRCFR